MTRHLPARRRARRLLAAVLTACALAGISTPARAVEPTSVPPNLQAAIFSRVLAFDRALKERAGKTVTIGILYMGSSEDSKQARHRMQRAFSEIEKEIQELPSRLLAHDYHDAKRLAAWIDEQEVDVLYVTAELESAVDDIKAVSYEKRVVTLTPVREFVERGLAVGVVAKGNRPQLVVNSPAARAAGMDLDPKALRLSDVIN